MRLRHAAAPLLGVTALAAATAPADASTICSGGYSLCNQTITITNQTTQTMGPPTATATVNASNSATNARRQVISSSVTQNQIQSTQNTATIWLSRGF
jgi:hypothetical protein